MQAGLLRDNGKIHNLPALNTENWGCLDLDGDDFYVDLFGIQWESEGENTVLFPDKDVNEDADIMEVNTIVSADAEVGDVSFCRSERCIEEEDKLDQGHDSDNVFSLFHVVLLPAQLHLWDCLILALICFLIAVIVSTTFVPVIALITMAL